MNKHHDKQHFDFSIHKETRIGVLSDTHSYINPSVTEHLKGCDLILHAGDVGSSNVIKQLHNICDTVVSVCGNNDTTEQWHSAEHEDLEQIPKIAEITLPGGEIAVTHGDEFFSEYEIWHAKLRERFPNVKAIVYGHSHRLICDINQDPWVLNPGPAGNTRIQNHGISCLRIHAKKQKWDVEIIKL